MEPETTTVDTESSPSTIFTVEERLHALESKVGIIMKSFQGLVQSISSEFQVMAQITGQENAIINAIIAVLIDNIEGVTPESLSELINEEIKALEEAQTKQRQEQTQMSEPQTDPNLEKIDV